MKFLIFLILAVCGLSMSARINSIKDCPQIAMATDADGNKVMFYFIPARGKLEYESFRTEPSVLLIKDEKGFRIFNTETFELLADVKPELDVFKVSYDGYLAYADKTMFNNQVNFYSFDNSKIWKVKGRPYLADPISNVLVCKKKKTLTAFEMSTGKPLWERTLQQEHHDPLCNYFVSDNDRGTIYMMADSLTRLDLRTGKMISRPFRAGMRYSKHWSFRDNRIRPANRDMLRESNRSVGLVFSLSGLHSNWIERGDSLFVADADTLYCFDHDLRDLWKAPLPEKKGSKSAIEYLDGKIYMQNFGIAFQNGNVEKFGSPFGAVFDATDGRRLSLTMPGLDKKLIGGYYTRDGRMYWQTNKKIFYSDEGDSTAHEIRWKINVNQRPDDRHPDYIINDTVYVVNGGYLEPVVTDKSKLLVEVCEKDVHIISSDGQIGILPAEEVYFHDWDNVYSTNRDKTRTSHFVIIDPKTRKIKYTFNIKGVVYQDSDGNIIASTAVGVGFLKKE